MKMELVESLSEQVQYLEQQTSKTIDAKIDPVEKVVSSYDKKFIAIETQVF